METVEIPGPLGRRPRRMRAARVRQFAAAWIFVEEAVRRLLDFSAALAALLALSPLMLLRAIYARAKTGRAFDRTAAVGRFRTPFALLSFATAAPGRSLAVLINVVKGDMSFAGPRPLTPQEALAVPLDGQVRFWIRPGIVSAYWLRKGIGVAYESEHDLDRQFYYGQSLRADLGLMARAIPGSVLRNSAAAEAAPILSFFGIDITNTSMNEAVEWIISRAQAGSRSQLCFVNPDCLNIAYTNSDYRQVLMESERVLPDGIGIHLGGRMKGTPMLENVNGTDLFPQLCARAAAEEIPLFLLGAQPSVAAAAAAAMQLKYLQLPIAGAHDGFFAAADTPAVIHQINSSGAKILLVAMGAPRQDLWLAAHRAELWPPVLIGVGGLFDFYSGNIPRAPMWLREIGLEWVWRLTQEPGRMWRRYLIGNPLFLYRVWKEVRDQPE
ncbi:MAG TPA: WecB/TagA/CpsF family glycosyltransferase [Candidatus Binataceae bacterium]|nr:WecB/TagA/CpsF family glycosyltransferase [Candidatus Binataceae bacterium]